MGTTWSPCSASLFRSQSPCPLLRPPLSTERSSVLSPTCPPPPPLCSFLLLPSQMTPCRRPAARSLRRPPGPAGWQGAGGWSQGPRGGGPVSSLPWAPGASLRASRSVPSSSGPAAGRPVPASAGGRSLLPGPVWLRRSHPRGPLSPTPRPVTVTASAAAGSRPSRLQGRGRDIFQSRPAYRLPSEPPSPVRVSSAHRFAPRGGPSPHVGSPRQGVASAWSLQWQWPSLNSARHAVGQGVC